MLRPPGQRPRAGCVAPFSGRRLCARPDNAAVDHQILVASILNQGLEHPLPDAPGRPAGEALVHALAGSVARRQITPARPGAQHPQHAIDEAAVVRCRTPRVTGLAWEQIFDSLPLGLGQFVAAGLRMLGLGRPPKIPDECRFGLVAVLLNSRNSVAPSMESSNATTPLLAKSEEQTQLELLSIFVLLHPANKKAYQ